MIFAGFGRLFVRILKVLDFFFFCQIIQIKKCNMSKKIGYVFVKLPPIEQ